MTRPLLTPEGQERLRAELANLRKVELPATVLAIEEARAHGDLSENAEYHAAKERNAIVMGKINELNAILAESEVITPPADPERVVFGVQVTVYDPETDEEACYQIVGAPESDASCGRVSMTSPIGQALLGKEEGDEVTFTTPGGQRTLEIVKVG